MEIKIYQINTDRDKNSVKFLQYGYLEKYQDAKDINASIYDEVFSGDVDCGDLEDIYTVNSIWKGILCTADILSPFQILSSRMRALTIATASDFKKWTLTGPLHKSRITL